MTQASFSENVYGLIIGISNYKDPAITKLDYTRADAEGIFKILADPKLVGIKQDKIKMLLDGDATKFNIEDAISDWLYKNADKDSTVLVYFAGHGGLEEDRQGLEKEKTYLLPYDSIFGKLFTTAISTSRFHELLASIRSKKLVFFLDSCHSGGICVRKGARDISPEFNPSIQLADGEGRLVIAAAQPDQRSWENEKLGHGIFTYHLIEALSGAADANKDGCVTISEVYNYLGNNVPKTTMQLTGNKQEPLFSGDFKRDFIMTVNYERMADKNLESIKKKNLERLIEWYNNNEISAERFELSSEVIEKNPEKLSDNDKKVSKLVNDLLSDKISISFFNKSVGLITGPSVKKGGEGAEENWKKIIELAHEANDLSRGGNHANAITKWQEILDIEPENRKAMEGLRESERILRQISDLNIYAQRLYDECMYTRALEKWNEVLKIDGYNKIALEGIEKLKNTQRVEKYCSSCGEPNISRDKFCGRCGACLIY